MPMQTGTRARTAQAVPGLLLGFCLSVGLSPGAQKSAVAQDQDGLLQERVERALEAASDLPASSITVRVRDGVVTLRGSVACGSCGGSRTPGGFGTVQQSLGAVVRAIPGIERVRFDLEYRSD